MRAVLCGYYGMGNGGDEALLATLLEMLPSHVTPVVLSGAPDYTTRTYGVTACYRKSFPQVIQALQQADVFIWGGGSLMQDATSALNPVYYGGLMILAQRMGLKTIAWAQGIGPLRRSPTRWLTRHCLHHCTAVSVRDQRSAELLKTWAIPVTCAPDPVWALSSTSGAEADPPNTDSPDADLPNADSSNMALPKTALPDVKLGTSPAVAIVLRPHPSLTEARLARLIQALKHFQQATQTQLLLIPFQPINDRAIANTIHAQFPETSQIIELTHPRQLHKIFDFVTFAIAMRLHGVIMAAAAGCQCWAISYDPKVTQLMQAIDLPGWELDQLPPNAETMSRSWVEHYTRSQPLEPERIQSIRDRACAHQDLLNEVLAL